MISDELLGKVIGSNGIYRITSKEEDVINIQKKENGSWDKYNRYHLAFLCKKYIEENSSMYIIVMYDAVFISPEPGIEGGFYFEKRFTEGDEPQRIFDACEWIYEKIIKDK